MISLKELNNALSAFAKQVSKIWDSIKRLFTRAFQAAEKEVKQSTHRESWSMVWDNRRESQVIDRKPLSFVRKVI